ncbi:MAG: (2Fe-2S) ferredoxin domain-containing protein [Clostridiales bacterium]|jgi:NADP-reducing hydrogenase subunit HndB|nr:(2Fe-2S) ferredoxin domain-containing protein [Clostridiales bacterium]
MSKIKSLDELKKIREQSKGGTDIRVTGENPDRVVLAVGMATCGIAAGARVTMSTLLDEIDKAGLDNVSVVATGCLGFCYAEPLVEVRTPGREPIRYANVDAARAKEIIDKHVKQGILLDNAIIGKEVPRQ